MTLGGLPQSHAGALVLSSIASLALSCLGLLLLRRTRPGEQDENDSGLRTAFCRGMAILGALFYFLGLVLSSMPFLVGSSGAEGRSSDIVQCTLVLFIAVGDCLIYQSSSLKDIFLCVLIWLSTTVVAWAGPRAYDNMTDGFESQIGGCDGGYRSAFLIYMSIWLTCIIFGSLLMVCEDGPFSSMCADREEESERAFSYRSSPRSGAIANIGLMRRKALPMIFGFCTSMSGLAFAVGAASDQLGMIFFGAVLLILAVLTAWDWLWRLELSLVMWAALTQGLATIGRTCQTHLAFRDLRWDVTGTNVGTLQIKREVGLPLFVAGFGVLIVTVLLLVHAVNQEPDEKEMGEEEEIDDDDSNACTALLEFATLAVAIGFLIPGLTLPLYVAAPQFPSLMIAGARQGAGAPPPPPDAPNMLRCINMAYTNELPCTALVSIFQFLIIPPMAFVGNILLIIRPSWLPKDMYPPLKDELSNQAPFRFMNPLMVAVTLAISHYSWNIMLKEITVPENNELINNEFGSGAYCMLGYSAACVFLSLLLSYERYPVVRPHHNDMLEDEMSGSDDDDHYGMDTIATAVTVSLGLIPVVGVAIYCALTKPFITFQIRLSGIILKVVHPTLLDLYNTLAMENPTLGIFAMVTFGWTLVVWTILFLIRMPFALGHDIDCLEFFNLSNFTRRLEQIVRPWVMTHLWALCFFLLFYILTGKNKAIQEVCVRPPPSALGLLGLGIVYFGLQTLLNNAKKISPDDLTRRMRKSKTPNLPGGITVWRTACVTSMIFWVVLFFYMGPVHRTLVTDYHDVNNKLEAMVPMLTQRTKKKLPHSSGDCISRWRQKNPHATTVDTKAAHRDCKGSKPLAQVNEDPVNVTARWIEGLDTLTLSELKITQPQSNVGTQLWNVTLSGEFSDLHIWLKVLLAGKLWIDDYMCCSGPFHFALRASALCDDQHGFYSPIKLEVAQLDAFDWKHNANWQDSMGSHISLSVDYGQKSSVQDNVRAVFIKQISKFSIRLLDNTELNPLDIAAQILRTVVKENSGSKCPRMPETGGPLKLKL